MVERRVTLGSKAGLHARPAALFVRAATGLPIPVKIAKDGADPVPANSLLSVLGLGALHGEEVVLTAEGEDAEQALGALADMLATELDTQG